MATADSQAGSTGERAAKFAILKHRDFRYYWVGTMFSNVGEHIENVIRNWLIWELTHSVFWLMVMVFMHWIPFTILSIPAGSIAERVDRQRLILWTEVGQCVAALGMFATTYLGIMDQYWMSALLILHSVTGALSNPARQLFLHDMVGRELLLSGIALTSSLRFATQSVGKPIGGFVLLAFGASVGFVANALAYLPMILALLTVIRVAQRPAPKARRAFEEFKEGVKHVTSDRSMFATLCVAIAPSVLVGNGLDPFIVIYADAVFGMGTKGYTYFITAMGIGAVAAVLVLSAVGNVQWKGKMVLGGIFGFTLFMGAFALSRSLIHSLIFLFLLGFFQVIYSTSANAMLLENVPSQMRGRVMGIYSFANLGLRVFNGPFFTLLNNLALLAAAGAFATHAITLTAAAVTVALLTFGFVVFVPGVSKQR
jgi:MFS family permease